jgi:MFS family permease
LDCELFPPGDQPPPCQNAHSTVVDWSAWTSFVSNTILTFLCAPIVGDLSDTFGRKPFLVASYLLSTLPVTVVVAYLVLDIPLLW